MMRKSSPMLFGVLAGAALTVLAIQPPAMLTGAIAKAESSDTYRQLNLFGDIFERVRAHYVEKPDDSKLVEAAISGMLNGLDPHSSYMDMKSLRDMQVQTRGEFGGLGIEVTMEDGLIKVVAPIDDTPAAKAGVRANDIITHIDDAAVKGMTLDQAVDKMRGQVNTKIRLRIMRKGADKPSDVAITRDIIRVRSVRSRIEGDDVGYIRITQFNEQTTEGLKKALTDISAQVPPDKLRGYVIDLRNNPGGPARSGDLGLRYLPRPRRDRLDPGARPGGDAALQCAAGRSDHGQADDRANQWRLRVGLRDRRRRAAGSEARDRGRHAFVRQGFSANHYPARRGKRSSAAHNSALLHPRRALDPGQGHRARH